MDENENLPKTHNSLENKNELKKFSTMHKNTRQNKI